MITLLFIVVGLILWMGFIFFLGLNVGKNREERYIQSRDRCIQRIVEMENILFNIIEIEPHCTQCLRIHDLVIQELEQKNPSKDVYGENL